MHRHLTCVGSSASTRLATPHKSELSNQRLRCLTFYATPSKESVALFVALTENFVVERLVLDMSLQQERVIDLVVQNLARCLPDMKGLKVLVTHGSRILPLEICHALTINTNLIGWEHNPDKPHQVDLPRNARNALRRNRLLAGAQATTRMESAEEFTGLVSLLVTNNMEVSGCAMYTLIRQFFPKFCRAARDRHWN